MPFVNDIRWVDITSPHERDVQSTAASVTSTLKPSQGTQLLIIIITVSTVTIAIIGVVIWSVCTSRQRHTKHKANSDILETGPSTKLDWKWASTAHLEVKPSLNVPKIVITSCCDDLSRIESCCYSDICGSAEGEAANIKEDIPSLEIDHFVEVNSRIFADEDLEGANNSSASLENVNDSFFSDAMLGELSTMAITLKQFSTVDSFDIKTVSSRRSSIVIDQEYEMQDYSTENICDSTEHAFEALGTVLLELETMADSGHCYDEPSFCSGVSLLPVGSNTLSQKSKAASSALHMITEVSIEESIYSLDDTPALSFAIDEIESTLGTSSITGSSMDTTQVLGLDNEEAFSTSTPRKVCSSNSGVDILGALDSPEDSTGISESNNAISSRFSSRQNTLTVTPNVSRFVPFTDPPRVLWAAITESDSTLPSPSRSPLGDIKKPDLANSFPRAPHPMHRTHARTSSRDKLQNSSTKKATITTCSLPRIVSARHFR